MLNTGVIKTVVFPRTLKIWQNPNCGQPTAYFSGREKRVDKKDTKNIKIGEEECKCLLPYRQV